jgi:hypothetical protein
VKFASVHVKPEEVENMDGVKEVDLMDGVKEVDLVQVRLRRKAGRDGLGIFAAFQMLLAKISCSDSQATCTFVGKSDGKFWRGCKCPKPVFPYFSLTFSCHF